jgi:hypothetical protein
MKSPNGNDNDALLVNTKPLLIPVPLINPKKYFLTTTRKQKNKSALERRKKRKRYTNKNVNTTFPITIVGA